MTQQDPTQPPQPRVPDPSSTQPPAAPPGQPLRPGAGSPLVPGPPMSVRDPIKDTTLNLGGLVMFAGIAIVVIIVIAILIAVLHH